VCPVLDLTAYPYTMDPKLRRDVRRAGNKLEKVTPHQFIRASETNFPRQLEDFFHLYEARWGQMDAPLRQFYSDFAAEMLAAGDLFLCLLHIDGTPAAAIFAFKCGSTMYCYLTGYSAAMAKLSPGAVLLEWVVERAIEAGLKQVDFLRDPEPYKYLWGARDQPGYKLRSAAPNGLPWGQTRASAIIETSHGKQGV
jgi:CelD/BcsL family acetyltransferase involved in cellulose biosynthesis